MKKDKEIYADCWSPAEQQMKKKGENIKGKVFGLLVKLLVKLGVTANMVSFSSAFVGIVSTIFLWYDIKISAGLLILALLIDAVDGSVARATNTNNIKGSLTDAFSDQITISATTIGFIAIDLLDPVIGGLYLVLYPMLIIFTILRNATKNPRKLVLRPRGLIYIIFWIYAFGGINIMNEVTLLMALLLLFQVVKDFFDIRNNINS
jgi:phosphatidylserine synthase